MKNRLIWDDLKRELNTEQILVITGPRQVGKTTTLKWILNQLESKNKYYFDLENIKDRELFDVRDYDSLLNEFQNLGLRLSDRLYIAIDEIQYSTNLPSIVKYLHDNYKVKFYLTGSSSFYIKNKFSESMAGRKITFEMQPLRFQEFLDFHNVKYNLPEELDISSHFQDSAFNSLKTYYQEYIEFGGLPGVVLTADTTKKRTLLEEIFSSYINIDVQSLADFRSTSDLRKVIKLLASRVGSRLNSNELSKIIGISRLTVESYLTFLEQTYIIRTIPIYTKSADVRERNLRKPYFFDTGIANINSDLSSGAKFENTICHQLSFYGGLSYFSTRDGEIDFILNGTKAFEVKETPTDTDANKLKNRAQALGIEQTRVIGNERTMRFDDYLWGGYIR